MRYHEITRDDMLNGEGLRAVLWLSGCGHHCPGCQNPLTWDPGAGLVFDEKAEEELFSILEKPHISGITLSGGDPLFPGNRKEVSALLARVRESFPEKNVWLYTGYRAEEIWDWEGLPWVDVLVDGRYEEAERDEALHWRGSSNQRLIDVKKSLKRGEITEYGD